MANVKEGYYVTQAARIRFRKWLVEKEMTFAQFCKKSGGCRQYMDRIIKGDVKLTKTNRVWFEKGGYDML